MKRVFVTLIRQPTKAGTDRELEPSCRFDSDDFTRTSNHDTPSTPDWQRDRGVGLLH